jgi:hypothetical protein
MGSENGENCTNSSNEIRLISVNGESRLIRLSDTLSQTIVTAIRQLHPMIDQHSPGWQDQIMGLLESRCPPLPIATTFTVDNTAVNFDATEPSSFVDKSDCGSSVITSYPLDYTQDSISSGQRTKLDILAETARDCFERDCRVPGWPKLSLDVDANGKAFVAVVPDAWL